MRCFGLPSDLERFCRVGAGRYDWRACCVTLAARGRVPPWSDLSWLASVSVTSSIPTRLPSRWRRYASPDTSLSQLYLRNASFGSPCER